MVTIEKRILSTANLRAMSQGDEMSLVGYAARFGVRSHDLGGYTEQIAPGAFKRSLAADDDVIATFNHDPDKVLGRKRSGTLHLAEDDKGLAFRCQLDKNQQSHRDLHAAVKRGDISDCSFAFNVADDDGDSYDEGTDDDGQRCVVRTLRNVKLMDVAVVTHPAYPNTSVDARAHYTVATLAMEDAALRARLAVIGKQIKADEMRAGVGFEVEAPRYQGGQAEDPQQSLRADDDDDDFDWDDSDTWDQKEHERCARFHRNCASTSKSMDRCIAHHRCADCHDTAARTGNLLDSHAARQSSKRLMESQVS
jgi:uncharacterized protein